jgi:hypothetical protein
MDSRRASPGAFQTRFHLAEGNQSAVRELLPDRQDQLRRCRSAGDHPTYDER